MPNLDEIRRQNEERKRLKAAATPGEWYVGMDLWHDKPSRLVLSYGQFVMHRPYNRVAEIDLDQEGDFGFPGAEQCRANFDFIARAKSDPVEQTVDELCDEVERLRAQLPAGMQHCTILFRECAKGHGWLTATNWEQHGCPTCKENRLREEVTRLRDRLNHQTDDDVEACRQGKHPPDCGR